MHFANPIGSFAVGTWIAGASVCGIAFCQRLPDWKPLVQILIIGNISLWFYFVYQAVTLFYSTTLRRNSTQLRKKYPAGALQMCTSRLNGENASSASALRICTL